MTNRQIIEELNRTAPLAYQENYDNSGIQVGNADLESTGALLTLDITEESIAEAIALNCNLIISHHPVLFKPLKNLTGKNSIERIIIEAIKNDITIFTAHTNMDNVATGVNFKIAEKLGLENLSILAPISGNICKLHFYVPVKDTQSVVKQLFDAGAGNVGNYSECSFEITGTGSFRPNENSHPTIGTAGGNREFVEENKVELIFPEYLKDKILNTLFEAHPYEEVAYGIIKMENQDQTKGAGMIGYLPQPIKTLDALKQIKEKMSTSCIRHTALVKDEIHKVALCGGSGSFLLNRAIKEKADIFITGDFKYHQFFEADNQIVIADIGHYESEQYTIELFYEIIKRKFPNFATHLTKVNTNPINYYF